MIAATHEALPGFRVWETSAPRMLAGRMGVTWTQEGGDPPEGFSGSDVIEFAPDGRIARVDRRACQSLSRAIRGRRRRLAGLR